jgi:tetratricopeptide (TPR) repeat protein
MAVRAVRQPPAQGSRPATPKMSQQELATSSHRLSRVPQKLRAKPETAESYAADYFQTHADAVIDKRTPADKLEEVDIQLMQDIEDEDRFRLLIQRKSLCYLVHGATSAELLESIRQLGEFYIERQQWESALRHLTKAHEMSQSVNLSDADALALAVDIAEKCLSLQTIPRHELNRQLAASESALTRYADIQTHDRRLPYRRDLALARICARRGRPTDAMAHYAKASQELDGEVTQRSAELYKWIQ